MRASRGDIRASIDQYSCGCNYWSLRGRSFMNLEQCYRPRVLGALVGYSAMTIRRMFLHEPGVILRGRGETRFKNKYWMMTIPKSVAERVLGNLQRK